MGIMVSRTFEKITQIVRGVTILRGNYSNYLEEALPILIEFSVAVPNKLVYVLLKRYHNAKAFLHTSCTFILSFSTLCSFERNCYIYILHIIIKIATLK
jgi:hypothetical protein